MVRLSYSLSSVIMVISLLSFMTVAAALTREEKIEKLKNMRQFEKKLEKAKEVPEILMLPEVESKLKFDTVRGFAKDSDIKGQKELRDARFWGRLYIEGWPYPLQYYLAHFSEPPPLGTMNILNAQPSYGCGPYTDDFNKIYQSMSKEQIEKTILLTKRGECSFTQKARKAKELGFKSIAFVNDRPGMVHAAGPDGHDLFMTAILLPQGEGDNLFNAIERNGGILSSTFDGITSFDSPSKADGSHRTARIIPIHCSETDREFTSTNLCEPPLKEEREYVNERFSEGGIWKYHYDDSLNIYGKEYEGYFEYLLANFGVWAPHQSVEVTSALKNVDTFECFQETSGNKVIKIPKSLHSMYNGRAVLITKSEAEKSHGKEQTCDEILNSLSVVEKVKYLEDAGASAVMVWSPDDIIYRVGVQRSGSEMHQKLLELSFNVSIPVITISERAGHLLSKAIDANVDGANSNFQLTFQPNHDVRVSKWQRLTELKMKEGWPTHPKLAEKLFTRLVKENEKWPERIYALEAGFRHAYPNAMNQIKE